MKSEMINDVASNTWSHLYNYFDSFVWEPQWVYYSLTSPVTVLLLLFILYFLMQTRRYRTKNEMYKNQIRSIENQMNTMNGITKYMMWNGNGNNNMKGNNFKEEFFDYLMSAKK